MSPTPASFELERFALTPVTDATVLLEIEGVLLDVPPRSAPPRLLVEGTRRNRREHNALEAQVEAERLLASFVVPAADAETASFALAVGGLLLDLPAPDPTPGADRTVALARELNGARRELARHRERIEADAETARGHAAELAAVREEAAAEAQEAVEAAEARATAAEQEAAERVTTVQSEAGERVAALERSSAARVSELEVAASQLETVLADVRYGAEQRDAAAATECRELEAELQVARADADRAGQEADEAGARADESASALREARSELELLQRAVDASDAELARSPDRRARAVGRPRTVAGVTGEQPALESDAAADPAEELAETQALDPGPEEPAETQALDPRPEEPAETQALDLRPEDTVEREVEEVDHDGTAADEPDAARPEPLDDEWEAQAVGPVADDDTVAGPEASADRADGDPVPDDGEADPTATHDAVAPPRDEPEAPEDTGPIPLRRGSQRRYVPRSDRDDELGGDAVRVLGRDRPRASPLPPPPDADPGPPALPFGLESRTLVIIAFGIAAFLILIAVLGYLF